MCRPATDIEHFVHLELSPLVGFAGLEPTTNRLWGGGFAIKLEAHIPAFFLLPPGSKTTNKEVPCTDDTGGPGETWTHDIRVNGATLYHLSYRTILRGAISRDFFDGIRGFIGI